MKSDRVSMLVGAVLVLAVAGMASAAETGSAFTYQGRLNDGGIPADGPYDLVFILYDDPEFGAPVGAPVEIEGQDVINGLFTVQLDFGSAVFNGQALWLEIGVRPWDSGGDYTYLAPRQPLNAAPYALYALDGPGGGPGGDGHSLDAADGDPEDVVFVDDDGDVWVGIPNGTGHTHIQGTLTVDTGQSGEEVLDQSQTDASLFDQLGCEWQCFTAGMDGYLARIEVLSDPNWFWDTATLTVFEDEGVGGPILYQGNYDIGVVAPGGVVRFCIPMGEAPWLTAGTQYTFEICRSLSAPLWLDSGNPYPCSSSFGGEIDFWFKTYMNDGYDAGGIMTVTAGGDVGIGTTSPVVRLDVAGSAKISKGVWGIPPGEFVDIDVNYNTIAALYSVVVQDAQNGPNIKQYTLMFVGSYYGCAVTVLGTVHPPGVPVQMGAEFGGVGSGPEGPYKLQIRHGSSYPVNVYITKIQTGW